MDPELNMVLVSVGADDGLKVGFALTTYAGSEYGGLLVVDMVGADWAAGHMESAVTRHFPATGDCVSTEP